MHTLITKIGSTLSHIALFTLGCVIAGFGVAAVGVLALFGLATAAIALMALPFISMAQPAEAVVNATAQPNA